MYSKVTLKNIFLLLEFWLLVLFPNFLLANQVLASSNHIIPKANTSKEFAFANASTDYLLSQMSLDEKIGQLFIIGFPYDSLDEKLSAHISKFRFGSFILFKRNIRSFTEIKKLNSSLKSLSIDKFNIPPLLAIDQEGGNVARIETTPKMPYFFHLGDVNDPQLIYNFGSFTAKILTDFGFNLNLAPVLDLASSSDSSFISLRSFGSDPHRVSTLGHSYSRALIDNHVVPTAKHFPGIGSSLSDPHSTTINSSVSFSDISKSDLVPFMEFSKLGPHSVMMLSHVVYNNIDQTNKPASFSKKIITDLLRKQIGYSGVVMTDDLQMKASSSSLPPDQAALEALLAGADIVMLSWSLSDQKKSFRLVKSAVLKGDLSLNSLNEKVRRILNVKKFVYSKPSTLDQRKLAFSEELKPDSPSKFSEELYSIQNKILNNKLSTLFMNSSLFSSKNLCVISNSSRIFSSLRTTGPNSILGFKFPKGTTLSQFNGFLKTTSCDTMFITVDSLAQISLLNKVKSFNNKKVVLLNFSIPYALRQRSRYFEVLDLYGLGSPDSEAITVKLKEFTHLHVNKIKSTYTKNEPTF